MPGRRSHCPAQKCLVVCLLALACSINAGEHKSSPLVASVTLAGGGGEIIRDALHSVVDWVDVCIVLDTGITDNTLNIAKDVAGDKLVVKDLPWPGSFSTARNAALDAAHEVGAKWAIILDTDERIQYDSKAINLREYLENSPASMINMLHSSFTYHKPRFFRLPRGGAFHGLTHEWYQLGAADIEHSLDNVAVFKELPKDGAGVQTKAQRDIALLNKETAANPSEQRWWYYLGDAYEIAQDCNAAVKAWNTCVGLVHGWQEEGAWCMYRAAQCHASSKEWDKALEALARGMTRHPGIAELPWYAGWVSYQAGRYSEAKAWSLMSIALGCHKGLCVDRIGFSHPPGKYEGPYDVLMWALKQLGDEQGAAQAQEELTKAMEKRTAPGAR